jgi:hypothetical protein
MNIIHNAIRALYPNAGLIIGTDEKDVIVQDKDGTLIEINSSVVLAKVPEIEAQIPLNECKQQAQQLLQNTDWSQLPDVIDTCLIPHLLNLNEFNTYRAKLRTLIVTPVENPNFPTLPKANWSN